jgi:hypothetical protein
MLHFVLFASHLSTVVHADEEQSASEETDDKYLYHYKDASPIIDYEAPPSKGTTEEDRPDFLYGDGQGPRVVEFYAPWCPHVSFLLSYLSLCRSSLSLSLFIYLQ